jgi:formyl-CoA transferase
VIKVEPPGTGDPLRKWRMLKDGTSVWWQVQSRNKRSLALDLKDPEAQAVVRQLALQADVLIENFRPGAMESFGLDPEALTSANPRLIVLRISGYGQTGPYRDKPASVSSPRRWAACATSAANPAACRCAWAVSIGDTLAALHGVIGILMA